VKQAPIGFVAATVVALIITFCGAPSHAIVVGGEVAHDCWVLDPNYQNIVHNADEQHGTRCAGANALPQNTDYRCSHSWSSRLNYWEVEMECLSDLPCTGGGTWTCSRPDGTKYRSDYKTLQCPNIQNAMKATGEGITCFTGIEGQTTGNNAYAVVANVPACP
jgi:hypothetical protein